MRVHEHGSADRKGSIIVDVAWKTANGKYTSVMGFAPLGCMPVTRRAPYVALALWPGDHENAWLKQQDELGIIGAPHGMDRNRHKAQMKTTNERVKVLLELPAEDAEELRRVTFALPVATAGLDALLQ